MTSYPPPAPEIRSIRAPDHPNSLVPNSLRFVVAIPDVLWHMVTCAPIAVLRHLVRRRHKSRSVRWYLQYGREPIAEQLLTGGLAT